MAAGVRCLLWMFENPKEYFERGLEGLVPLRKILL